MTARARAYRATHAPDQELTAALPAFHAVAAEHRGLNAQAVQQLARTVQLPVATLRGAASSFDDSKVDPRAVRVCAGTSCMLAGGGDVSRELNHQHKCHPVYCLGYCDRSPVAMTADGKVVPKLSTDSLALFSSGSPAHPQPPSIRCTARHAIITARIGKPDPVTLPDYTGLHAALKMQPADVTRTIIESGLRGRGGAAYITGKKWQIAAAAPGTPKFIVANGDEGDPGSFIDRELMERDPHAVLEGMAIAAHAVGASRGIVFIRSEYPVASDVMTKAIDDATHAGHLGPHALGKNKPFEVEVVRGMGSYVCGEETALLAAIEGQRGEVWPRPPYPVEAGVFGKPTVVVNVETLANVPWIMSNGTQAYTAMGTADSKGTKTLCFNHGFARPGIVELEFGVTLRTAINDLAGGGANGAELEAVLLGGPMGSIVTPDQWDVPICFIAMGKQSINLGHAGLVAIPKPADWTAILRHLLTFMRDESCGKCVPCRLGSIRAHEIARAGLNNSSLPQFQRIMSLMKEASLCAFGRETPGPVKTILDKFSHRIMTEVPA
ncbi:MAG: NAD(P)H-dependent oxidoreductase subunit E [Planctomycetes bacterium]|nr:NAD(P)H-dependent oxidoreductase subunit E [Planctomycetota bacterium]